MHHADPCHSRHGVNIPAVPSTADTVAAIPFPRRMKVHLDRFTYSSIPRAWSTEDTR